MSSPTLSQSVPGRYVPALSTAQTRAGVQAVVYLRGEWCAVGYIGKAIRAAFNYRFRSEESRAAYVAQFFDRVERQQAARAERNAQRAAFRHSYAVGDIVARSWGYEQTNVNFYQVTAVPSGKTVRVREIASTTTESGFMCGHCVPRPGEFKGPETLKRVAPGDVVPFEYGSAQRWDGRPMHCSWYH